MKSATADDVSIDLDNMGEILNAVPNRNTQEAPAMQQQVENAPADDQVQMDWAIRRFRPYPTLITIYQFLRMMTMNFSSSCNLKRSYRLHTTLNSPPSRSPGSSPFPSTRWSAPRLVWKPACRVSSQTSQCWMHPQTSETTRHHQPTARHNRQRLHWRQGSSS